MLRPVWLTHGTGRKEGDGGGGGELGKAAEVVNSEKERANRKGRGETSLLSVKTWEEQGGWGEFGQDHGLEDED